MLIDHNIFVSSLSQSLSPGIAKRRKPLSTYQSPPAHATHTSQRLARRTPTSKLASSSSATHSDQSPTVADSHVNSDNRTIHPLPRRKQEWVPPLPLYHPLGFLALSVKPLKDARLGLRMSSKFEDTLHHAVGRRRQEADQPIADEVVYNASEASEVTPIEKPSPRRRRGGGAAKRRRRDLPDGDSPYPAKRTRTTRATAYNAGEDASSVADGAGAEGLLSAEYLVERPVQRRTRQRTLARRSSTPSDGTASSVSASLAAGKDGDGLGVPDDGLREEPSDQGESRPMADSTEPQNGVER